MFEFFNVENLLSIVSLVWKKFDNNLSWPAYFHPILIKMPHSLKQSFSQKLHNNTGVSEKLALPPEKKPKQKLREKDVSIASTFFRDQQLRHFLLFNTFQTPQILLISRLRWLLTQKYQTHKNTLIVHNDRNRQVQKNAQYVVFFPRSTKLSDAPHFYFIYCNPEYFGSSKTCRDKQLTHESNIAADFMLFAEHGEALDTVFEQSHP